MMNRYEIRVWLDEDKKQLVVETRKFPNAYRYSIFDQDIKFYLDGICEMIRVSNIRPPYFTFDGAEIGWDALNDKIDELQV